MTRVDFPEPIRQLIAELKRLPGIGSRSAERIAIWMLQSAKADPAALASAVQNAHAQVISCPICGFFSVATGCAICDDPKRDEQILCVVEQATDVLSLERTGSFFGRYHCLGGKLSPLDRVAPEDLNIQPLLHRIDHSTQEIEVILALGTDVEGEATANYLAELLKNRLCRITRIAQGLPVGGGLEHADALTLTRAMLGRQMIRL